MLFHCNLGIIENDSKNFNWIFELLGGKIQKFQTFWVSLNFSYGKNSTLRKENFSLCLYVCLSVYLSACLSVLPKIVNKNVIFQAKNLIFISNFFWPLNQSKTLKFSFETFEVRRKWPEFKLNYQFLKDS